MRDTRTIRLCTKPVAETARTLIIIAAIVSVAMASHSSSTPTPSAEYQRSSDATVEAGWETLPNRLTGFQIAYPQDMVWIPGGEFTMGWDGPEGRPDERPANRVCVDGFWMDETEVTNAQFRAFVEATGYATTAERVPDWEELKKQLPPETPRPPDDVLVAGSLVFVQPPRPVPLNNAAAWWRWTPGADWRYPEGPGSSIEGRDDHPVVHVSYDDALAFCKWAGKRLPTEAEWEYAARGGLQSARYIWGDEPYEPERANIWNGRFPDSNSKNDGFVRTAPVKSYPANGFGLYDMAGNVWEWCIDWYRHDYYRTLAGADVAVNPAGPADSFDPQEPTMPKRVQRGGSFLCNDSYCEGYRPSARMKASPDTSLAHSGFRCVLDAPISNDKEKDETR